MRFRADVCCIGAHEPACVNSLWSRWLAYMEGQGQFYSDTSGLSPAEDFGYELAASKLGQRASENRARLAARSVDESSPSASALSASQSALLTIAAMQTVFHDFAHFATVDC